MLISKEYTFLRALVKKVLLISGLPEKVKACHRRYIQPNQNDPNKRLPYDIAQGEKNICQYDKDGYRISQALEHPAFDLGNRGFLVKVFLQSHDSSCDSSFGMLWEASTS
jgi:hypothetical protein